MILPLEGGCLCGAIRFRVSAEPLQAGYCHCRMCQRQSGAPVVAWATVPTEAFAVTSGTPGTYHSSANGMREFCGRCGTYLWFRDRSVPMEIAVNLGCLDDPNLIRPDHHIWTSSRISWFDTADDRPRYAEHGPASPDATKEAES